jgi:hypothetical protein
MGRTGPFFPQALSASRRIIMLKKYFARMVLLALAENLITDSGF